MATNIYFLELLVKLKFLVDIATQEAKKKNKVNALNIEIFELENKTLISNNYLGKQAFTIIFVVLIKSDFTRNKKVLHMFCYTSHDLV